MSGPQAGRARVLVVVLAALAVMALTVVPMTAASAHPLNTSAVLLDVTRTEVTATVDLPLDQLSIARGETLTATTAVDATHLPALRAYVRGHLSASDAAQRRWTTMVTGGKVAAVDGVDTLVLNASLSPESGTVGDFVLHADVVVDELMSHRIFVSGRYGHSGTYTVLAMLSWQTPSVPVAAAVTASAARATTPAAGFVSAVSLGAHHIASGSDHVLFLLMLLLPAPLLTRSGRWRDRADVRVAARRVVHGVTAFAVGHSVTLALGALGWVDLPTWLVESGIALSVLVSAVHAIRPLVRGGEVIIAGGFGLLHGLAFAALLSQLDLSRSSFVTTLLGFNLGIELTQLLVVALVMPSLVLLSRTPGYRLVRFGGATLGAALSTGWLFNRVGLIDANPLEPVGDQLVDHPLILAAGLALLSVLVVARRAPGVAVGPSTGDPLRHKAVAGDDARA